MAVTFTVTFGLGVGAAVSVPATIIMVGISLSRPMAYSEALAHPQITSEGIMHS